MAESTPEQHAAPQGADGSRTGPEPSRQGLDSTIVSRWVVRCGLAVFVAQFAAFASLSAFRYNRFNLGTDFAIYSQAWTEIGRGHLTPQLTIYGFPFLRNNLELITWPLALIHPAFKSPIFGSASSA